MERMCFNQQMDSTKQTGLKHHWCSNHGGLSSSMQQLSRNAPGFFGHGFLWVSRASLILMVVGGDHDFPYLNGFKWQVRGTTFGYFWTNPKIMNIPIISPLHPIRIILSPIISRLYPHNILVISPIKSLPQIAGCISPCLLAGFQAESHYIQSHSRYIPIPIGNVHHFPIYI